MNIKKKLATPFQNYRQVCSCVSQRVEYRLSELCENLILVLSFMWNWGESYKVQNNGHLIVPYSEHGRQYQIAVLAFYYCW